MATGGDMEDRYPFSSPSDLMNMFSFSMNLCEIKFSIISFYQGRRRGGNQGGGANQQQRNQGTGENQGCPGCPLHSRGAGSRRDRRNKKNARCICRAEGSTIVGISAVDGLEEVR